VSKRKSRRRSVRVLSVPSEELRNNVRGLTKVAKNSVDAEFLQCDEMCMGESSQASRNRSYVQSIVTLLVLFASLAVILSGQYDANSKHWAFGTVGTILGYWFKGGR
jgi:hypothetical protein